MVAIGLSLIQRDGVFSYLVDISSPFSDESRQHHVPEDPRDDVPSGLRFWQSRQVSRLRSTNPEFSLPPAVIVILLFEFLR